jgi:hypothetical protein
MKYTPKQVGAQPGRATWKFEVNNKVIYRLRNRDALNFYWANRDQDVFNAYVRTKEGWQFVLRHDPSQLCQCGKPYDDTPNGEPFRFQEPVLEYTIEELTKLMHSPVLCMMCYYRGEIKAGRWAPKYVRQRLGLES